MGFLLRRTKRALAGWFDDFNRPNENPVQPPWNFWGDPAVFSIVDNKLKLAAEGAPARGGNLNGGVAYEHQPLTEHWGVEFTRAPIGTTSTSSSNETTQNVFLDKNWTEGGNAATTVYQVWFEFRAKYNKEEKDEDGKVTKRESMDRNVRLLTREKTGSIWVQRNIGADNASLSAAVWAAAVRVRMWVFYDRYLIVWINDAPLLLLDLYDPNYKFGPKKRSANFAQVQGLVASIDDFKTYDLPQTPPRFLPSQWSSYFYDDFERPNNTTAGTGVGNGWTQSGGNNWGIYNGAVSMGNPLAGGSDGFRQIRRNANARNVKIGFVTGNQGTGSPNATAPAAIMGRVSADGTRGIAAVIQAKTIQITPFTWGGTLAAPSFDLNNPIFSIAPDIDVSVAYSFTIEGDYAWLRDETNDRLINFAEGMNAISPEEDTWVAAFISRYAFINSSPLSAIRILT